MQDCTVEHAQLLDQIGYNSFNVAPEDLLVALRICSLPWNKARRVLRGGWTLRDLACLAAFKLKRELFTKSAEAFERYLSAARETPRHWPDKQSTRICTCPTMLMLQRDLQHYWHYTADQVRAMPLGEAEWRRLAMLEAEGVLTFFTDADEDLIEAAKKMAQEEAAESAATEMEAAHGNG